MAFVNLLFCRWRKIKWIFSRRRWFQFDRLVMPPRAAAIPIRDAWHYSWDRQVENIPCSCTTRCQTFVPFVPFESSRFQPLVVASLWHADFGTKFSLVSQSNVAMMRIRHVQRCSNIAFHGISFLAITTGPVDEKVKIKMSWN